LFYDDHQIVKNGRYDMSKSRCCLITYVGLALLVACWLMGCSSGASDGGDSDSSNANVTQSRVASPGVLGDLEDIGDLVDDGENWYETRVMCLGENDSVGGQTTVVLGPAKGAFLWEDGVGMTYLGIHGDTGGIAGIVGYNYGEWVDDPIDTELIEFIYSEAVAIGPNGEVACNSTTGTGWPDEGEKRAFYWNGATQIDLPPDQSDADSTKWGEFSEAFDINSDFVTFSREYPEKGGDILAFGYAMNAVTTPAGSPVPDYSAGDIFGLAQIIGAGVVEPVDINNNHEAITNSVDTTAVFDDLMTGGLADLGDLSGDVTEGAAINDAAGTGHVAGTTGDKAFFWDGGSMVSCGDLGGGTSEATDINNNDRVVGHSTTASGNTHAFSWRLNDSGVGVMTDLGTLGGDNSWAVDINDNNLIVGRSETGETYTEGGLTYNVVHACAWYNNVIYDLGIHSDFYSYDLADPFPFSEAIAVNNNNRIAGNSYSPNAHYRGFIVDSSVP
jgi:probable HAF family extracellular repeat protein